MLTDVTIDGLRGVGRVELRFVPDQRVYTLFGSNGVGKTKCLEAIYQFLLFSNAQFAQETEEFGVGAMPTESYVMERMRSSTPPATLVVPKGEMVIRPSDLWSTLTPLPRHSLPIVYLGAAHRSSVEDADVQKSMGTSVDRRRSYFDMIAQATERGRLASLGMVGDIRAWFVARAQSVNPYQKATDNRQAEIDAVLTMLSDMDSRIDAGHMQIDGAGHVFLSVESQLRELGELSSGFTSLVKLVQAVIAGYAAFTNEVQLRDVRGVVLIDEIESHLHAAWQSSIVPRLKKLLPNTTFFVATHSPLVLAQLQEGEAYLLRRDPDGTVRSELIDSPDRRAFADVLESAFGVDLNALKRQALERDDQSLAKQRLLLLLAERKEETP